jgi:hypothetical protein
VPDHRWLVRLRLRQSPVKSTVSLAAEAETVRLRQSPVKATVSLAAADAALSDVPQRTFGSN